MPTQRIDALPQYQILVVGDPAVGKTSLIGRYIHNEYPCYTRSHTNSDGSSVYPTIINDHECLLTFIDVSPMSNLSQLKISRTIPTACLIVFSICDQRSFEKIRYFQDSIDLLPVTQSTSIPIIVLANKTDFEQDRAVSKQSIEKLKSSVDYVIETSVRTNQGIHQALEIAIKLLRNTCVVPQIPKRSRKCIII